MSAAEASLSEVRQRVAHFTRTVYPRGAEKALQRDFDISESTAERVLRGQASQPIINQMLAKWGWRFASFVLEPVCGRVDNLELAHRLEATERLAREALYEANAIRQEIAAQAGVSLQPARGERDLVRHVDAKDRPQADALAPRRRETAR